MNPINANEDPKDLTTQPVEAEAKANEEAVKANAETEAKAFKEAEAKAKKEQAEAEKAEAEEKKKAEAEAKADAKKSVVFLSKYPSLTLYRKEEKNIVFRFGRFTTSSKEDIEYIKSSRMFDLGDITESK